MVPGASLTSWPADGQDLEQAGSPNEAYSPSLSADGAKFLQMTGERLARWLGAPR